VPVVFSRFPLLDLAGTAIDAVAINSRTRVGITAAFGVVDFTKNEFKVSVRRLFGTVRDAIQ
jgi:RNase P/RNase MRP subunit p29